MKSRYFGNSILTVRHMKNVWILEVCLPELTCSITGSAWSLMIPTQHLPASSSLSGWLRRIRNERTAFAFSVQRVPLQSHNEVWSVTTFNREAGSVDLRHFQLSMTGNVWLSLRLMSRQTCETRGSWGEWFELHARQIQFQVSPLHGWVAYKTLWVSSFWRWLNAKLCWRM